MRTKRAPGRVTVPDATRPRARAPSRERRAQPRLARRTACCVPSTRTTGGSTNRRTIVGDVDLLKSPQVDRFLMTSPGAPSRWQPDAPLTLFSRSRRRVARPLGDLAGHRARDGPPPPVEPGQASRALLHHGAAQLLGSADGLGGTVKKLPRPRRLVGHADDGRPRPPRGARRAPARPRCGYTLKPLTRISSRAGRPGTRSPSAST